MIKLIVGLGNPGQQYEKTRHNAGFLFLDDLAAENGLVWSSKPEFQSLVSSLQFSGDRILLLKPQSFMNKSGYAVGNIVRYYKLAPKEVLVVHDELDFNPGIVKLKENGGHAGHNGLRDIIAHLGSSDFYRLRLGIGRPGSGIMVSDYVLSAPNSAESQLIGAAMDKARKCLYRVISGDIELFKNDLNAIG